MALRLKGKAPAPGAVDKRSYMIDVQEGYRRVRLSSGTRDLALAQRKEQAVLDALRADPEVSEDVLRELVRGKARTLQAAQAKAAAKARTLREAMDEALADRNFWGGLISKPTLETNCRVLCAYLGEGRSVAGIDQTVVDDLVDRMLRDEASPATVNRKLHALRQLLRREKKAGRYPGEVPEYRLADERDNARTFVLSVEDEELILSRVLEWDGLPDPEGGGRPRKRDAQDYHDLFVFLADVGCRLSQAFALRWSDVVTRDGQMMVRFWRHRELKKGLPRTMPCTTRVTEVLKRRRAALADDHPGPFSMCDKSRANKLWRRAIKGTHLEAEKECVIHALRHTCATRLLEATGNIKLVQEWLGHRDIRTTSNVYAKVLAESKAAGLSALEALRTDHQVTPKGDVPRQGMFAERGM